MPIFIYLWKLLFSNYSLKFKLFSPGWQAFFPVPFAQYNKEVAPEAKDDIEVKAAAGHFDIYRFAKIILIFWLVNSIFFSFDEACFYHIDYMTARSKLSGERKTDEVDSIDL